MPVITYQDRQYESSTDESVLDALLRHNIDIPYSCKTGVCSTCVMLGDKDDIPKHATKGLKETLVDQGYFLACQCVPPAHMVVRKAGDFGFFDKARVLRKDSLSRSVCRLSLRPPPDLRYRAGQYIHVRIGNGQIRSYSLASLPEQDDCLELHIKRMENGIVSNWLVDELQAGDDLDIRGPFGDCFYLPENPHHKIVMIATGTGLAPLLGIVRDAIHKRHQGQIELYHGVRDSADLYLDGDLKNIVSGHSSFRYFPCVSGLNGQNNKNVYPGRASEYAFANNRTMKDCLVYLCGSPQMVAHARKQAYLDGADMKHIYADPFVTRDLRLGNARSERTN